MQFSFELPDAIGQMVLEEGCDPSESAKRAVLVNLNRLGKISAGKMAELLGLYRMEADGILMRHEVYIDISVEEHEAEVRALREETKDRFKSPI